MYPASDWSVCFGAPSHHRAGLKWAICVTSLRRQALGDDPQLLLFGPSSPAARIDHLKPFDLRTVRVRLRLKIEILRGNGRSGNVGMSAIDGMIAALVAGPAFVHPEKWLPIIFGGRVPDVLEGTPVTRSARLARNTYTPRGMGGPDSRGPSGKVLQDWFEETLPGPLSLVMT
jgi:hypothetical protein